MIRIGYDQDMAATLGKIDAPVIGTKVINCEKFDEELARAILEHILKHSDDGFPGQLVVDVPKAIPYVTCGIGSRTLKNESDYVVRLHRGHMQAFLKREHALDCTGVRVIVYTRDAYLNDPDVIREGRTIDDDDITHVIVAVLAHNDGPAPVVSPLRFVANLAGGNREDMDLFKDQIHAKAAQVIAYDSAYCVVSD